MRVGEAGDPGPDADPVLPEHARALPFLLRHLRRGDGHTGFGEIELVGWIWDAARIRGLARGSGVARCLPEVWESVRKSADGHRGDDECDL